MPARALDPRDPRPGFLTEFSPITHTPTRRTKCALFGNKLSEELIDRVRLNRLHLSGPQPLFSRGSSHIRRCSDPPETTNQRGLLVQPALPLQVCPILSFSPSSDAFETTFLPFACTTRASPEEVNSFCSKITIIFFKKKPKTCSKILQVACLNQN